ncbi:MAG TPA: acyl carrier protein [Gaiellaceae bacterium]|jgi:acyl carrier protein|nr:acyl carrier protein [Gaiellaceae bacterium]
MVATDVIRSVLATYGGLPCPVDELAGDDDLYRRGLTSHASVNVMLALEAEFDVEFDDTMLRKSTFESIDAIRAALGALGIED